MTTPFDVIKTRRQVGSNKEKHLLRLTQNIMANDGVKGFFKGKKKKKTSKASQYENNILNVHCAFFFFFFGHHF